MLKASVVDPIVKAALHEDVGPRDITTSSLIPPHVIVKADIEFREKGILCGIEVAERVFRLVDPDIRFLPTAKDGEVIEKGREVAYIEGPGASVLVAERVALNFLSHLSGIATKTRAFVDKVKGTSAKILDTRKTTPNLRVFERYAVKTGGGTNHRFGLFDQILIKDNHLRVLRKVTMEEITDRAEKGAMRNMTIGLEVKNLMELAEALKTKVDYILLDNMSPQTVKEALNMRLKAGSKIAYEVSGGITLDNVLDYAKLGVERISIGALTHDAHGIDVSLDIVG